ncbi:MAG: E3 binding domain-containing protein [Acidobacteriota bacterium]
MAHRIVMPSFGMYTAEGTLGRWMLPAGSRVVAGQAVAELYTEKANYEVEAPADGTLHPVLEEGAPITVEGLLGWILADGEAPPVAESSPPPAPRAEPARPAATTERSGEPTDRVKSSPAARRLAQQMSVDLAGIAGSGPGGRITEADVLAAAKRRAG